MCECWYIRIGSFLYVRSLKMDKVLQFKSSSNPIIILVLIEFYHCICCQFRFSIGEVLFSTNPIIKHSSVGQVKPHSIFRYFSETYTLCFIWKNNSVKVKLPPFANNGIIKVLNVLESSIKMRFRLKLGCL
ncbi:hypothetical protein KUTeg_014550 [Tegillarca granosa]|uniref:Maturase K n=1 Tax=Tegillarca granosa TaxID=220873 RepID=A0ABQ9EXB0_TEGGR|nr:hypothetical protein KUTeg_014550 [Tegillarca granosa]